MSFLKAVEFRMALLGLSVAIVILDGFLVLKPYNDAISGFLRWGLLIASFAVVLGIVNAGMIHGRYISQRAPGKWYFSAWLLFCLVATVALAIGSETSPLLKSGYDFVYIQVLQPVSATIYSLCGFFFASMVYRSLRVRNRYIAVFLVMAILSLLYYMPAAISVVPLQRLGQWAFDVPNVAGTRGIIIGTAVGIIAGSVRALMGAERGVTVAR